MKSNFCKTIGQTLIACLALLAMPARAQVNYAVSGSTAYVTSSPNASGNVVIASSYNGFPVTSIGQSAFLQCYSLTNVTIPNSVTSIGDSAFTYSGLTDIAIPASVTNIGNGSFFFCSQLASILVDPLNSTYSSFDGILFNKSRTVVLPGPTRKQGGVSIPASVTNISERAFFQCVNITDVIIPSGVVNIEDWTFTYCPSLTNVLIPNGVTSIGLAAFETCANLTSVTIPTGLSYVGGYAFFGTGLRDVAIPNTVAEIGMGAFGSCGILTNVTLASGIPRIADSMFGGCTNLSQIIIPTSVTTIGNDAFSACTSLTNLTFLGDAPVLGNGFVSLGQGAKVCYFYGRTGWGTTYGGLPAVMLGAPAPQVGTGSAGVKLGSFGFTLNGVVNQTIVVEASTNLANWQPISTSTLSTLSTNFVDPDWVNHPNRFYRLRSN